MSCKVVETQPDPLSTGPSELLSGPPLQPPRAQEPVTPRKLNRIVSVPSSKEDEGKGRRCSRPSAVAVVLDGDGGFDSKHHRDIVKKRPAGAKQPPEGANKVNPKAKGVQPAHHPGYRSWDPKTGANLQQLKKALTAKELKKPRERLLPDGPIGLAGNYTSDLGGDNLKICVRLNQRCFYLKLVKHAIGDWEAHFQKLGTTCNKARGVHIVWGPDVKKAVQALMDAKIKT